MIRHFHETTVFPPTALPAGQEMDERIPPRSGAFGAAASESTPLARRFDWLLNALPVERMPLDRSLLRAVRRFDPDRHLVLRRIRCTDGAVFDLVALPRDSEAHPARLYGLRKLRARRHRLGRPMRLIREAVVDREPRLSNARLIDECAGYHPSACATERLIRRLDREGGSARLEACLPALRGAFDPACTLLALVGSKVVAIDLEQPLGPDSRVSLMPRRVDFAFA
ncbi:hypothetical protein [Methylobacterium sp. J-090]|uniref:hypothetical protein n=1 Tax=Methylobacterium sp. J-090 TaxID=2836666 RepID=UPI001FBABC5E|nr:hypothetical protein [Methylobacterium sp. J-090]MCJ2082803.1 hypothetical protein [Methylobacterium sp. J-090]